MKTLILVRHAKSDWPENTEDFDRPLAESGLRDAAKMANFLKDQKITIEQLVSSPAMRALKTCEIFQNTYSSAKMVTHPKLYNANENNFEAVIEGLEDHIHSVALFSHNNGISNFANMMSGEIVAFPTCGVAGFKIDCTSWADFADAKKKLVFFYEPKKI